MRTNRLTERDLSRIVKRVINEQDEDVVDLSPVEITIPMKTKDLGDVTIYGNKTKKLCEQVILLMDDISDELQSCKDSPDAKTQIEGNVDLNNNIKDLMKKLKDLIAVPFSNDNSLGL